jgi:hypothetical protein
MGKTYRRNESLKPKGKDFKHFKKSKKFKKWDEKPHHSIKNVNEPGMITDEL